MGTEEKHRNSAAEAAWNFFEVLEMLGDVDGFGVFIGMVVVLFFFSLGWKIILKLVDIFSTGGQG
jgi:hypothetical protein